MRFVLGYIFSSLAGIPFFSPFPAAIDEIPELFLCLGIHGYDRITTLHAVLLLCFYILKLIVSSVVPVPRLLILLVLLL